MKKLLKDPLIHFLLIGAVLFFIFDVFSKTDNTESNKITITSGDLKALEANFTRTWQRTPTDEEMQGIIEEKIRDEIAFREAIAMGLDRDDAFIRRRLRMKMEMLIEDIGSLNPPTDEALESYLKENKSSFRREPQLSFSHIFLNPDSHPGSLESDIESLLALLKNENENVTPETYGDPTMLPRQYPLSSIRFIRRQFGRLFADGLVTLESGSWQGPIESSYGLHLVYIHQYQEGSDPALKEIRDAVEREFMSERRKEIKENTYSRLRKRYTIEVEQKT